MSTHLATFVFLSASDPDQTLCDRICAEYHEMPGMKLTLPQAARLFNVESTQCARLLDHLVQDGALAAKGGIFALPDAGRQRL